MKQCVKCGCDLTDENIVSARNRGRVCKKCNWKQQRAYRYSIAVEELEKLLKKDLCDICGNPVIGLHKHIDHDHKSNQVRGILCRGCNQGLGNFNDDPKILYNAIKYLKS